MRDGPCCGPGRGSAAEAPRAPGSASPKRRVALRAELMPIPGGFFEMGTRRPVYPQDHDGPRRRIALSPFAIAPTTVTNARFAEFARETGYVTTAEVEGWSYVFHLQMHEAAPPTPAPEGTPWWRAVRGACWHRPEGPGTDTAARADHPVVHVSWHDAAAYAAWAGLQLPTEAQWERAARGGLERKRFPRGNVLEPDGRHCMNVWQGVFPDENTAEDGHAFTAPAGAYPPNGYGLHQMTGNVWEWCADRFGPPVPTSRVPPCDPTGPERGEARVQRGGSFLCHASYCRRYEVHSRTRGIPDDTAGNLGFRVAAG